MSESEARREAMNSSEEEAPGKFFDSATSPSASLVWRLLEPQVVLLRWYLETLEDRGARDALDERMGRTVRALMSAGLELTQAIRQLRQELVEVQTGLIKDYLATVEDLLRRMEEHKLPSTADHPRATRPSDLAGP